MGKNDFYLAYLFGTFSAAYQACFFLEKFETTLIWIRESAIGEFNENRAIPYARTETRIVELMKRERNFENFNFYYTKLWPKTISNSFGAGLRFWSKHL